MEFQKGDVIVDAMGQEFTVVYSRENRLVLAWLDEGVIKSTDYEDIENYSWAWCKQVWRDGELIMQEELKFGDYVQQAGRTGIVIVPGDRPVVAFKGQGHNPCPLDPATLTKVE